MNNHFLLIKVLSVVYYAHKLGEKDILEEVESILDDLPKIKISFVSEDRKVELLLRELITWVISQPISEPFIKSLFDNKVDEITFLLPELKTPILNALIETDTSVIRTVIFENLRSIRNTRKNKVTNAKIKSLLNPIMFNQDEDLSKEDWLKLCDILEEKIGSFAGQLDKAVMEEANSKSTDNLINIVDQLKLDMSPEGVYETGFQGVNKALGPDFGFRRGLFYLINALTNKGKSFFLAHLLCSFVLYNKPMLKDPSKIPTIFFCSAEDSMGLILKRMYQIFYTAKTGKIPDFKGTSSKEIIDTILATFKENGWDFAFYRVDPTHDNIHELKQRVRNLEMRGHEIIVGAYDYAGMMSLDGCNGETKSDKLQDLIRQLRNFWIARNAIGITPHQLNPRAKAMLIENNDDSELEFVKVVGGNSMTEGSTKITNEVDGEITVHVAKTKENKTYLCYKVGKMRGEGAPTSDLYGFYEFDVEGRGLLHDINGEAKFRRTLESTSYDALGDF